VAISQPLPVDLLKSHKLGQAFDSASASYKFYWLLGILDLLPNHPKGKIPVKLIQAQMVALALPTVAYFRLTLGKQDRLQDLVRRLVDELKVPAYTEKWKASNEALRLGQSLEMLSDMVPTRFLSPWSGPTNGLKGDKLTATIEEFALKSQGGDEPTPYYLNGDCIQVGEAWRRFLTENRVAIEDYTKLRLVGFLESRNIHSQSISKKLEVPTVRNLARGRNFWAKTLAENRGLLMNIYSGHALEEPFEVDHFIPFSFEAADLLWNLIPTDKISNIKKSDSLPDIDRHIEAYAAAHKMAIAAHANDNTALADHCAAFAVESEHLVSMTQCELSNRLKTLITPRLNYAMSCGFSH
jgi:hypothetical protein